MAWPAPRRRGRSELAPDLAEAHASLAIVQRYHDWDWSGAEQSCRRALELAPENAEALTSYGWLCYHLGRFPEANPSCSARSRRTR
jgi:Tfp pilus assembly protein PilF